MPRLLSKHIDPAATEKPGFVPKPIFMERCQGIEKGPIKTDRGQLT